MTKSEARKIAASNINKLSEAEREWAGGAITDAVLALPEFEKAQNVFIFLSTATEPNTSDLMELCFALKKKVSVPKLFGDKMQAISVDEATDLLTAFYINKWNIYEPYSGKEAQNIDLAIVPLAAFDNVNRVGHGKGYYDKFFAEHACYKLGIAFDCQEIPGIEFLEHDVALDALITEKRLIFANGTVKQNEMF